MVNLTMGILGVSTSVLLSEVLPAIIVPNVGGIIGAILVAKDIPTFYEKLKRPSWRPPNWLFGPMWTTLYVLMGISSWLVYRSGGGFSGSACCPLTLYATQLLLNWSWSPTFFHARRPGVALVIIGALWINIVACIFTFYPINHTAAYLMVPYLAWVSLATALNKYIVEKNPNASKMR